MYNCRKIQLRNIFRKINISTGSCQIFKQFYSYLPKIFTTMLTGDFEIGVPKISPGSVYIYINIRVSVKMFFFPEPG